MLYLGAKHKIGDYIIIQFSILPTKLDFVIFKVKFYWLREIRFDKPTTFFLANDKKYFLSK